MLKDLKAPNDSDSSSATGNGYAFGPFRLDTHTREVWRGDKPIGLTPKAFDLLHVLVTSGGRAVEKNELMKLVWPDSFVGEDSLTQNIATLRKALGDASDRPHYIGTVPRHGYRFVAAVHAVSNPRHLSETDNTPAAPGQEEQSGDEADAANAERAAAPPIDHARWHRWAHAGMTVAAMTVLTTGLAIWTFTRSKPVTPGPIRFVVAAPEGTSFSQSASFLAMSPNGRMLAFLAARPGESTRLWVRPIESLAARELPGTDGALGPFWSPDSQSLGFVAQGQLKTVNLLGEPPKVLCGVEGATPSGTWSQDGIILFARGQAISRVSAVGGVPTPVTSLDAGRGETVHLLPQFLADGRHFLYVARSEARGSLNSWIVIGSLDGAEHRPLIEASSQAVYVVPGYLMFSRDGALVAQPFDPGRFQLSGAPLSIPETDHIDVNASTPRAKFSPSQTGVVAYRTSTTTELGWFDRDGHPLGWVGVSGRGLHPALSPALSPDGQRLAVSRFEAETDTSSIWLVDLRHGSVGSRFTTTQPAWETCPVWSPDGSRIVFASGRTDGGDLYEKNVAGTTEERSLPHRPRGCPLDMSPDGRYLVYATPRDPRGNAVYRVPSDGEGLPTLLAGPWSSEPIKRGARISPDGHWLAYVSPASGRNEIYVRSFRDDLTDTWQISSHGGIEPEWRGDGRELFFIGADRQLMAVPVTTNGGFRAGTPTALFLTGVEPSGLPIAGRNQYVVSSDGQRFLINQPRSDAAESPVTLLVNWPSALKR